MNITREVEDVDNRVSSGLKNRVGAEPKSNMKKEIPEGWVEERRRKEQTEKTLLGPAKNNEGILPIGVVCTGPTWLGPMLDLEVKRSTKKRGRSQPNRKIPNPNSRT